MKRTGQHFQMFLWHQVLFWKGGNVLDPGSGFVKDDDYHREWDLQDKLLPSHLTVKVTPSTSTNISQSAGFDSSVMVKLLRLHMFSLYWVPARET